MAKQSRQNFRGSSRDERPKRKKEAVNTANGDFTIPEPPEKTLREPVKPLTQGQKRYDAAFKSSDIVFGIGPAGTGKTWFAIQRAIEAIKSGAIKKIYVTRPAVEVGEGMGFLPGELNDKFAPYLIPVEEAFVEGLGRGAYEYYLKSKKIEPVPIAFIRGRTLKDAWVIADEMQNATQGETKAVLTRIGTNAKFIINGDPTQIDDKIRKSGLLDAAHRLGNHSQVSVVNFHKSEIVRSGLCQDIVEAYETN